jgi:hypothetical protein
MADAWTWAELDERQMGLLKEAEETLGADILLAFQKGDGEPMSPPFDLAPADLDESQVECLEGAEEKLNAVVIAYQPARS